MACPPALKTLRRTIAWHSICRADSSDLACNDGELLYDWVKQGLGIGWRSTWEIQAELKQGSLMTVLDDFALPEYDIQAVYPQQRYLPAKVRYFIDYLKEIYNRPGYWDGTA
jgi:DNA-binding transcriptional LysR family regulator